jgi:hypothetical protein
MKIIDTIKIAYKELFTITLLHPSFESVYTYKEPVSNTNKTITGSSIFNVISVEPDIVTKKLFINHSINFKNSNNIISCFIRAESQQPLIKLPDNIRIRFLLKQKADFLYRTNIVAAGSRQVYRFTNENNTIDSGIKHITKNANGVTDADLEDISTVAPGENCLGVIDILTSVTDVNYRLLNGDTLESPEFVIRFIKK